MGVSAVSGLVMCFALLVAVDRAAARAAPSPKPSTKYVLAIIGDSLSDVGNTYRAAEVPDSRLYWNGRFTDGPNWVDHLRGTISQKHQLQIFNYAWGGATACPVPIMEVMRPYVRNATRQTMDLIADITSGKVPSGKGVKLVPVQWIGSNDVLMPLLQARATNTLPSDADMATIVQSLVTCRIAAARLLAGVRGVKEVVLLPISPMHSSPAVPAAMKPAIKQLGVVIAQQTAAAVAKLQEAMDAAKVGVTFHLLGDFTWMEAGFQTIRPAFKHLEDSCFVNVQGSLTPVPKNLTACDNPTEHSFYDETHPESRFHNWFATKGFLPRMRQLRLLP